MYCLLFVVVTPGFCLVFFSVTSSHIHVLALTMLFHVLFPLFVTAAAESMRFVLTIRL
jgi:hypothetical protein